MFPDIFEEFRQEGLLYAIQEDAEKKISFAAAAENL